MAVRKRGIYPNKSNNISLNYLKNILIQYNNMENNRFAILKQMF